MNNTENIIDAALISVGSVYSMANLEHILGVIILVLQLIWISSKFATKIYKAIKNKKHPQITQEDVHELNETLEDLNDVIRREDIDGGR